MLSNDLSTTQKNLKTSWYYCLVLSSSPEMKILSVPEKISRKIEIENSRI